jgi:hypothetical protein
MPERIAILPRDRGKPVQPRVWLVITRQHCKLHLVIDGAGMQCFQPIGPIAFAADNADHDKLGVARGPLNIGIDGHGMRQSHHISEPQRHDLVLSPGRTETCQFRIGSR